MSSFTEGDSVLQVLIVTIAFGMGVNPPNVCYVLHCGPPHDVELYVQEIGQGGRDCGITYATTFYSRAHKHFINKSMVAYCEQNSYCRHDTLFSDFDICINMPIVMSDVWAVTYASRHVIVMTALLYKNLMF